MRLLPVLTNSSITTFRRCPREYQFRYIFLRKLKFKAAALKFGSLFHIGLNAWWAWNQRSVYDRLVYAVHAMRAYAEANETDPFELVKAECLMAGYTARWGDEPYETIAVEKNFRMAISGPDFGCYVAGSIDAIVRESKWPITRLPQVFNVEHKTTSADISPGSDYWRGVVALDPQVSTYDAAAKAMGYDVRGTIYDVIRKPEIQPLKATPEDKKKYTIPTKKEPTPRLYKDQREDDETLDEYRERLTADIIERPAWYFARQTVVRLERDNEEHARDVVMTAQAIHFAEEHDAWPRHPNACERFHRLCDYHPVCSGEAALSDSRYEDKTRPHEELDE